MAGNSRSTFSSNWRGQPDRVLVLRAQRGEEAAFQALFSMYNRRVYALCFRMTRCHADAEDLMQDAFLKVFRKISTFRGESAFSSWLYRLVINEVMGHHRKNRASLVPLAPLDGSQEELTAHEFTREDSALMRTPDRMDLNQAIAQLPRGYRAAFVLHDIQGYEHQEIARIMKWVVGTSKSQLHKARCQLRTRLQHACRV